MNAYVNDYILESLREIAVDQPISERAHYVETVLEATTNTANNTRLVEQLYSDVMKSSEIDFGKIPDSKGDLTKYRYYEPMVRSLEILNELVKTNGGQIITLNTANKLHMILLDARDDFVFGYKFDIDLIKYIYQNLVMALYELISCGISEVADFVRSANQITINATNKKTIKKSNRAVKSVNQFIKAYEAGQWSSVINNFKKNRSNFMGGAATESFSGSSIIAFLTAGVSTPIAVILALITILFAIRGLVFLFYYGKTKIADYAKAQAELIKANIENDRDQSDTAVAKQQKMALKLESIAARLEGQRRRAEQAADKAITQSNKTDYTKQDMVNNIEMTDDFELV